MSEPSLREVALAISDEITRAEVVKANVSVWGRTDEHRLACLNRAFKVVEFVRLNEAAVAAVAKKKGAEL